MRWAFGCFNALFHVYSVYVCFCLFFLFICHSNLHISGTTQAGDGSPEPQRALTSIISNPTRIDADPDRLTMATMTATDTCSLPQPLLSRSEEEPCLKTTSALTAATAGHHRFLWRPARRWARWRKELAASGKEKLQTLHSRGRKRHLPRDRRPRSGSSFTAGGRLTTPCSPLFLLLLLTPPLQPLTPQRDTILLTPPHTSLHLKHPDSGPTVFLQRGRKC